MPAPFQFKALTGIIQVLIIRYARDFPGVYASPLFLPTDHETESSSADGCHAPAQATGDGKSLLQDTGLLNIAGEKMAGSGTLGYPRSQAEGNSPCRFFFCKSR